MRLSEQLQYAHETGLLLVGWPQLAASLEAEVWSLREQVRRLQGANIPSTGSVSAPPQQAQQPLLSNAADDAAVLKRVQEQWAIERAQRCCIHVTGRAK